MDWTGIIIALVGGMGGIELVKYLLNKKQNSRIAEAQADDAEFQPLRTMIEFLQAQLQNREEQYAGQTERLRQVQAELFEEIKRRHSAELELATKRCEVTKCPKREPQNGY